MEVVVDPSKVRPSPQPHAEVASPVPSLRSQDSAGTVLPHEETRSPTSLSSGHAFTADTSGSGGSFSGYTSRRGSVRSENTGAGTMRTLENANLWPFAEVFATRRPVHVPSLPDYAVDGFQLRGWGEPAREAIIIPICAEETDIPAAVLVMGLNSRRPYNDDYATWIDLFRLAMNSMITAVKGREADLIRAE